MPWFYVDDGFSDSKPVLNMPDRHRLAACGLWVLAGSWSAKEELDGFVPNSKLRMLGARPPILAALTEPGPMSAPLCEKLPTGIQFNSWDKWQKTRDELNEKRREDAERKRKWREENPDKKPPPKLKGRNAAASTDAEMSQRDTPVTDSVTDSVTDGGNDLVSRCDASRARTRGPDPTRPDPLVTYVDNESSRNVGGDERGLPPSVSLSATRLIATLIPDTIPTRVRNSLRVEASDLMNGDGIPADVMTDALRLWLDRPGAGSGLLAHLVADVQRSRTAPAGKPHKLRAAVELAQRLRAEENAATANQPRKELQ
jgi:hypothetical protein